MLIGQGASPPHAEMKEPHGKKQSWVQQDLTHDMSLPHLNWLAKGFERSPTLPPKRNHSCPSKVSRQTRAMGLGACAGGAPAWEPWSPGQAEAKGRARRLQLARQEGWHTMPGMSTKGSSASFQCTHESWYPTNDGFSGFRGFGFSTTRRSLPKPLCELLSLLGESLAAQPGHCLLCNRTLSPARWIPEAYALPSISGPTQTD